MSFNVNMIPEKYQKDIDKAIKILKNEGCNEIYIFGSLVNGNIHERSDIDFAVNGLPENKYFKVMGKMMMELDNPFDLIDLDEKNNPFVHAISKGEMVKIAANN
jgi:predicted nucleotidyltransferase